MDTGSAGGGGMLPTPPGTPWSSSPTRGTVENVHDSALTGPLVVVAVLVAATAFGLWRRRRDGRLRPVIAQPATLIAAPSAAPSAVTAPSAASSAAAPSAPAPSASTSGLSRPGVGSGPTRSATSDPAGPQPNREQGVQPDGVPAEVVDEGLLTGLGVRLGTPVTLLQFSSAFCQPCRATRRVLGEVAGLLDGVEHVEVDAESQLAAVRALNVWRTPTTLVVDAEGRIVQRAAGVPGKAQVIAALAPLLTGAGR